MWVVRRVFECAHFQGLRHTGKKCLPLGRALRYESVIVLVRVRFMQQQQDPFLTPGHLDTQETKSRES